MGYIDHLFGLRDVRAIVTGGAGALPKAIASALLRCGASVSIWGRGTSHPIADAVEELRSLADADAVVSGETVDTGDSTRVESALASTEAAIGMPNVLVNGVGGSSRRAPFVETDESEFLDVLNLNLMAGLVVPTKAIASRWIAAGVKGSIINIASMGSYLPLSGGAAYSAAKSAVVNLTYGTAKELAAHGIRVNAIAPGFFLGNQNRALLVADDETGALTERGRTIVSRTPFGRFGEVEELEGAAVYLASPVASSFVTGVCIPVDGGFLVDNI